MLVVALQNLVAYSVNMLDNIMLGSYSQNALSGAATVNQIFFIVNQLALSIGNALVAICSQYWGKQETEEIRKLTGAALALSILIAAVVVTACTCMPERLLGIFTTSPEIIAEGKAYLGLLKWTFLLFMISNLLIAMLRSVEVVKISFVISVVSLITNGCINYTLIFGHFGFPEMGIKGAAVGTLTARMLELLIIVVYVWKIDTKVRLFDVNLIRIIFAPENRKIWRAFLKVAFPIMCSGMIWAISVPMQTAILGHLSADAIAANSVSSTFFQYLKVIVIAISSASAVVIGKDIGEGDIERVKSDGRTLSVLDLLIGDPRWLYHPICVIGNLIAVLEKVIRKIFPKNHGGELTGGFLIVVLVCLFSGGVPLLVLYYLYRYLPVAGFVLEVFWCYQLLATRSLKDESMKVYDRLKNGTLDEARYAVSMIVGRDTRELTETGVTKAAVETVAENASDGVIAPMLYMAIGGVPLMFLYKGINTMDSMLGYKNDKYLYFGRIAAKLDDVANYIPARISGWLMVAGTVFTGMDTKNAAKIYKRDRRNHASPNSAQTEAAMAGALDVQLAGNAYYFGKLYEKPTIGDPIRPVEPEDIKRANRLMYAASILGVVVFGMLSAGIRFGLLR